MLTITKNNPKEVRLDVVTTERIWENWCIQNGRKKSERYWPKSYNMLALKFDALIFPFGGRMVRENKKYYLVFENGEDAIAFKLKYGT